jgi:hypothetical protein
VEPCDARPQSVVFAEVAAHPFREQFLPAIPVFRHGGVGVFFLERNDVFVHLLLSVVNAGAAGVEEPFHAFLLSRLQQVSVDQHRQHAEGLIIFDEPHAAHVGGEVVDVVHAATSFVASFPFLEVGDDVLGFVEHLIPLVNRLHVDAANLMPVLQQSSRQVTANETAAAGDEDFLLAHVVSFRLREKTE